MVTKIGTAGADNLVGTDGSDTLQGLGGNDQLTGGKGADVLDGGSGIDTLNYGGSAVRVVVELDVADVRGGDADGDRITGFENVTGSAHDDQIFGDAGANRLSGGAGIDLLDGLGGDDVVAGGAGADDLSGGLGIDTLDYGASAAAVSVLLRGGDAFGGGDAQGDTIIGFENITGSAFNDVLVGDDGANALRGGGGNDQLTGGKGADVLDGGAGVDTARYDGSPQGVFVDMFNPIANGGDAAGDTLVSIENLTGSAFLDRLVGDDHANILLGNGSIDALLGHGGNDVLVGGTGADQIDGGAGNDIVAGGPDADFLDGGTGIDTVDYTASAAGVSVHLDSGEGFGGDAAGDTINGFENAVGSALGDEFFGNAGANVLNGKGGDDFILGAGGNDVVVGGFGADQLDGGDGIDTLDYSASAVGVFVDLSSSQVFGGDAEGDTIAGFENVTGSAQNDTLVGDIGANRMSGGTGNDFLFGNGGNDVIVGSIGADFLFGDLGRDELTGGTDADRFAFTSTTQSGKTATTRDVIHDFHHSEGDKLVLDIDGNAGKTGFQTLSFIGTHAFTAPGQVRSFLEGDHTVVEVNTAGTSGADMQLQLDHHVGFVASDFIFAA